MDLNWLHWTPMDLNWLQWTSTDLNGPQLTPMDLNWPHWTSLDLTGPLLWEGGLVPDPYHGGVLVIDRLPVPHYPGTTTPLHRPQCTPRHASQGQTPFTRLHSDTRTNPKYRLCQNHHFLLVKTDLVKTALFVQKPYLILIVFAENAIFALFRQKQWILHFSGTPLVFRVFHCFRVVRFSLGFVRKVQNLVKYLEIMQNWHFSPKCHRQIWYLQKCHFWLSFHEKNVIFVISL